MAVFASTTDREIHGRLTNIRRGIGKQHQDALDFRFAQLERWLEDCGVDCDRSAIARAVYGRHDGLRRPTKGQAIARTDPDRESELYSEYQRRARERGMPEEKIPGWVEQQILRRLRGSEPPARAAVRMAGKRYQDWLERLNEGLASPIEPDPLSHSLTMLFGALGANENDAAVRRRAADAKAIFTSDSAEPLVPGQAFKTELENRRLEAINSTRWGVVPVFPWTTNPETRALVKQIRARILTRRNSGQHPSTAPTLSTEPEPHSRPLTMLFRALDQDEDAAVRRRAEAVRASFRREFTS